MDDLIAFLRAQLDEEQAAADGAQENWHGPWELENSHRFSKADAEYYASVPARQRRAEVAAKRQIIEWLAAELDLPNEPGQGLAAALSDAKAIKALKILALPYADHPDYRSEWSPVDG